MKIQLLTYTPDADKIVAAAAKLCYAKSDVAHLLDNLTDESTEAFLNKLSSLGHESPVEHASFTFAIEGVSRALLAQLTRHRIASFSVQSQRYVSKSEFTYITPPEIADSPEALQVFLQAMRDDVEKYNKLRDILIERHYPIFLSEGKSEKDAMAAAEKKANEDARYVLPNACDTRIIMTMNVRSLYNFFRQRCCNRAQWEIRAMASEMLLQVKRVCPLLFKSAGPACVKGKCPEGAFTCGKMSEIRKKYGK